MLNRLLLLLILFSILFLINFQTAFIPNSNILSFADSNFFSSLVTVLVGLVALGVYYQQKRDYKRDAAAIILMEVRYAERMIEKINTGAPVDTAGGGVLPTNNWNRYNYLFTKDLDVDELDLVNKFYGQCLEVDKCLNQLYYHSQVNEKAAAIQQGFSSIALQAKDKKGYEAKKKLFLELFGSESYLFRSGTTTKILEQTLLGIAPLTTSTAGEKFKKLAKMI